MIQEKISKNNILSINNKCINELNSILNDYLEKITKFDFDKMNVYELANQLDVISASYHLLNTTHFLDSRIIEILKRIIIEIDNGRVTNLSIITGLTELAFSIYTFHEVTGYSSKLLSSINQLLISQTKHWLEILKDNGKNLNVFMYDTIYGLAGIGRYLLMTHLEIDAVECLRKILLFFVKNSNYIFYNNSTVLGWFIKPEEIVGREKKEMYPRGYIDYGISHGMAGPLMFMALAYNCNIRVPHHKEAMQNIINEYQNAIIYKSKLVYWPGIQSFDEYVAKKKVILRKRISWCYGSVSILNSLRTAAIAIDDKNLEKWCDKNINDFLRLEINQYDLNTPMVCHGYAGILFSIIAEYKKHGNLILKIRAEEVLKKIISMYNSNEKYPFENIEKIGKDIRITREVDFLRGSAGVILALIGFVSQKTYFEKKILLN